MFFNFIMWPGRKTKGNNNTDKGRGGRTTAHTLRDTNGKTKIHIKCTLEIHEINVLSCLGCCYQRYKIIVFLL